MNFIELNLAPAILQAVQEQGYETPTPIQAQAIPAVLAGQDKAPSRADQYQAILKDAAQGLEAAKKKLAFKLDTPREVRPGTEARFGITSDQPARLVVYAVDEGIHQITAYKSLGHVVQDLAAAQALYEA